MTWNRLSLCGLALLLAAGCGDASSPRTVRMEEDPPPRPTVVKPESPPTYADRQEVTANKVTEESKEAWDAATEFAAQSKDKFVAEARRRLDKLDVKIAEYERKVEEKSDEISDKTREEWRQRLGDLKERRHEMQKKLDRVGEQSSAAWDELSAGAKESWKDLSNAFRRASEEFDRDPETSPR